MKRFDKALNDFDTAIRLNSTCALGIISYLIFFNCKFVQDIWEKQIAYAL